MAKSKGKTASQIVSESRQELVDQLIQKMKDGVSPVREMWDSVSTYGLPNNPISGARYQGVNLSPIKIYILVKRQMIFRQPERLKLNFVVPENLILV